MKYSIDKQPSYTIMEMEEENINSVISADLKAEFVMIHAEGVPNLIFDMQNIKYVDSSGLSAILTGNRVWSDDDGIFCLANIQSEIVEKLIEISKLDQILLIFPTLDEATDYVMMDVLEKGLEEE